MLRRVPRPQRRVGDVYVIAAADGTPIALDPTSGLVWARLDEWRRVDDLDRFLANTYPDVPAAERTASLSAMIDMLTAEALVEFRPD